MPPNYAAGYAWCCEITGEPVGSFTRECRCRGCFGYRCAQDADRLRAELEAMTAARPTRG